MTRNLVLCYNKAKTILGRELSMKQNNNHVMNNLITIRGIFFILMGLWAASISLVQSINIVNWPYHVHLWPAQASAPFSWLSKRAKPKARYEATYQRYLNCVTTSRWRSKLADGPSANSMSTAIPSSISKAAWLPNRRVKPNRCLERKTALSHQHPLPLKRIWARNAFFRCKGSSSAKYDNELFLIWCKSKNQVFDAISDK